MIVSRGVRECTAVFVALALAGCGAGSGQEESAARVLAPPSCCGSPYVPAADPTGEGCATVRLLGTAGTAEQYLEVAGRLTGSPDVGVASAAAVLRDATAGARVTMVGAVLDLAEECLRAAG